MERARGENHNRRPKRALTALEEFARGLLQQRFDVVRVKNRFENFDPDYPASFRNVHMNIAFYHRGQPLIVEVQLHLRALFAAGKEIHAAYEVVRAVEPHEVSGPPFRWGPKDRSNVQVSTATSGGTNLQVSTATSARTPSAAFRKLHSKFKRTLDFSSTVQRSQHVRL